MCILVMAPVAKSFIKFAPRLSPLNIYREVRSGGELNTVVKIWIGSTEITALTASKGPKSDTEDG